MIKRILLGLGGTPFTDVAIERAPKLAKVHNAMITGVTVVDTKQLKQDGLDCDGQQHPQHSLETSSR